MIEHARRWIWTKTLWHARSLRIAESGGKMDHMTPGAEKLLQEALSLPEEARVDLAEALLESVEQTPAEDDADAAWSVEARRRLDEVRSGAVKPVPWEEAEKRIFDPSDDPQGR
jgi:putative addiction module component (TIGR02574 family)